jgi:exodeoxyribonuclease V alpha subunit
MVMSDMVEEKLVSLSKSKFRSSFKLSYNDKKYIYTKGIDKIKEHAFDFVNKRLSSKVILNDGKQTPMKGHPVFIAQHATGTCCRGCLYKWHGIKNNRELYKEEIEYIVNIIMEWININLDK